MITPVVNFAKLAGFRKGIRPASPESLPQHVDSELDKVARSHSDMLAAIKALDARLTAHGW